MIPEQAVEAAMRAWGVTGEDQRNIVGCILEAAAPHMLAEILEDAANTAETDELTTAAEVIYDLRRHAKDLRPTSAV
jgi:hypothetical protein